MGHEQDDARTFERWGVDYLKYGICSYRKIIEKDAQGDPELAKQMMFCGVPKKCTLHFKPLVVRLCTVSANTDCRVVGLRQAKRAQICGAPMTTSMMTISASEIGFAQTGLSKFSGPGIGMIPTCSK
jgi:alpha-galactosidase